MNEITTFRINSKYAEKINQIKNKSEFLNNLIENYYNSEKKSNDDIITKIEKLSLFYKKTKNLIKHTHPTQL